MTQDSQPQASVIVPVYNSRSTIARALESALCQTLSNIEIIVIDDGSTDILADAIAPYRDRIKLIQQRNAGAAAARNRGAVDARANLLAFLDADDFWHPRKLQYQVEALRQHQEAVLCYTDVRHIKHDAESPTLDDVPVLSADTHAIEDFDSIFSRPYLGTPSVVMRRDTFTKHRGFREDLSSAEDVDLWLRSSYGQTVVRVKAPLTYVVDTPNSLGARESSKAFENNLRVIDDFCAMHPEFATTSRASVMRAKATVLENWASHQLVAGNSDIARRLAFRSLRSRPSIRAGYLMLKAMIR